MLVVLKNGYKIKIETVTESIGQNMVPLLHLNGVSSPMQINSIILAQNFNEDNLSYIRIFKEEQDKEPIAVYKDYKYLSNFTKTFSGNTASINIILNTIPSDPVNAIL